MELVMTMFDLNSMNKKQLGAVRGIVYIGAGNAGRAMSKLLGCTVEIDVPKVELVSIYNLGSYYDDPDSSYTAVLTASDNMDPFNFMLLVKENEVERLVGLLVSKQLGMEMDVASLAQEIVDSALGEIGNILLGSFLNAVNGILGVTSRTIAPSVTHDMLGSILSIVAAMFGQYGDVALVTKSSLTVGTGENAGSLDANILIACDPQALETLLGKLGVL